MQYIFDGILLESKEGKNSSRTCHIRMFITKYKRNCEIVFKLPEPDIAHAESPEVQDLTNKN